MAEITQITCRRCAAAYAVQQGVILPACPRCGKAPASLLARLRDNRVAAVLATIALVVLAAALTMPFMEMTILNQRREFSLIGGIRQLFQDNHTGLALILLTFSVIFPIAKLVALLIATSRLAGVSMRTRRILHKLADLTGKYSILDVLVVAVLIVMIKFRNSAEAAPLAGVGWFCAAVFLSIFAGMCVALPKEPAPAIAQQGDAKSLQ